jgi:anti-sigma factor RsiW
VKLARDEMHVLTGGYALDALAPQEMDAFERHLQHCGPCAAEVRGLRETAARFEDAVDLDTVRADLAGVVQAALEPAHLTIWTASRNL